MTIIKTEYHNPPSYQGTSTEEEETNKKVNMSTNNITNKQTPTQQPIAIQPKVPSTSLTSPKASATNISKPNQSQTVLNQKPVNNVIVPVKAKLIGTSSIDFRFPPENIFDGNLKTFWLSTGMFPQYVLLELSKETLVKRVVVVSTGVALWTVEKCNDNKFMDYIQIGSQEMPENDQIQQATINITGSNNKVTYLRLVIQKGYNDFCSVRKIIVSE